MENNGQKQRISYLNGFFIPHRMALTHVEDRGYQFADAVYEVVESIDGKLVEWDRHLKRLRRSLRELRIDTELTDAELTEDVLKLMQDNELSDSTIYIQISRGISKRVHEFPKVKTHTTNVMTIMPRVMPQKSQIEDGVKIITHPEIRWKRCDIKSTSLLPNTMAKQQAVEHDAVEAVFVNEDKTITECSAANFFIVDNQDNIITHPLNNAILGGVTREGLMDVAAKLKIKVNERAPTLDEAFKAKEAFITSTTKHVLPVVNIDNKVIADGKVGATTRKLIEEYENYIRERLQG